jgi:hypothetical protein
MKTFSLKIDPLTNEEYIEVGLNGQQLLSDEELERVIRKAQWEPRYYRYKPKWRQDCRANQEHFLSGSGFFLSSMERSRTFHLDAWRLPIASPSFHNPQTATGNRNSLNK